MDWEQETAKENLDSILEEFYKEDSPDILCTAYDPFAAGALEVLEERQILPTEENWPFITGVGCEVQGVVNVAEGTQGFTVFLDNRALAEECVKLVDTYMQGESPEVNDYEQYDNGKKIIGTVTCAPQLIDADNYQIVIDNGFYSEQDILPLIHPTDTPIPEVTEIFEAAETSQETETIEGTEASEEMETSEETETSEGTEASEEMEASEEPQTDEETQTSEEAEISDKVDILERIFRSSSRT
jgi:putative multiple sugar transport system substrate-binding protein